MFPALDFSAANFQLLICMSSLGVIQVTEWRTITVQVAGEMNPQYLSDTSPSSLERERRSTQEDNTFFPASPSASTIIPALIAPLCLFTCTTSVPTL